MATDISITLDNRRKKKNNTYPVKLRVYSTLLKKAKLYSTGYDLTEKEFESIWQTEKPRKIHKEDRNILDSIRVKAVEAAKNTNPFSFELFEKKLNRRKGDSKNVIYHYNQRIEYFKSLNQYGTADTYNLSLKSILNYIEKTKGRKPTTLPFHTITPTFLQKYENYMVNKLEKSFTTVSIYTRSLRAVFNTAIRENEISPDLYPFGKGKYEIPGGKAVKKALTKPQLKILYNAVPKTPEQEKAKDFWFFSFICNGINIKDIALLKYRDIKGDEIHFIRAKTKHTSKTNQEIITVHLIDFSKAIIKKYGNTDIKPNQHVFPILDIKTPEDQKTPKVKNFTRFINQHIKKLAEDNGLPAEISTYWARHTFATLVIQGGSNMEFVKEALGHKNITTTQNYFAGFEDKTKKAITENLLKFE